MLQYPSDFIDKVVYGDCIELMQLLPDLSVDLVFTDLPYGTTAATWDIQLDVSVLWRSYNRLLKPGGVVLLFASQPFTAKLIASNETEFKYCWYWLKNQGTNFYHANRMPIRKVEEICVFKGNKYNPQIVDGHMPTNSAKGRSIGNVYFGDNVRDDVGGKTTRFPTNILEFKCVNNYIRVHSAQKPVDLCEYLIRTYTDAGDCVLDNCAGSGSIGVACAQSKRSFIGMELDFASYAVAHARIAEAYSKEQK